MSDVYRTAPVPTLDEAYLIGRHHGERAERERIVRRMQERLLGCDKPACEICDEVAYIINEVVLIKGKQK